MRLGDTSPSAILKKAQWVLDEMERRLASLGFTWASTMGSQLYTVHDTMVYSVRYLIAYLSQFMSLRPGDIIATGTPPGVGMGFSHRST